MAAARFATRSSTTTNGHSHPPEPASAAPSTSSSVAQSKVASASTALDRVMGLLDGFEDDMDCPLCLEEMDISDLNFKPCPCGYQICRFCWHHIKENLNGRCPACRTPYDDTTVEFKAIKPEELKRLQAAKKLRDKRRKEEALTVKNLASVRVRQRAQVHIQGMTTKIANEDTLNQLKGPEQFGQYGKVVKLFMSKRSTPSTSTSAPTHPHHQPVNVYVNYRTPVEAAACIAAMDGMTTPDGHRLKAIWGTTRYCPTYLKGGKCNNENCMQAHEPGEEIEGAGPISREEMYTFHAMGEADMPPRSKSASTGVQRKQEVTLPPTASWASKNATPLPAPTPVPLAVPQPKAPTPRVIPVSKPQTHPLPARPSSRATTTPVTGPIKISPEPLPQTANKATKAKAKAATAPVASSSSPPLPVQAPLPPAPAPEETYTTFPDLEFGEGTFSFSLDPDAKGKGRASPVPVLLLGMDDAPFDRPEFDTLAPPSYMGSFDPFSDGGSALDTSSDHNSGSSSPPPDGDELSRRGSRFGFARRSSHGVGIPKSNDLASAFARSAFSGRESPAVPPGFPQHRSPSSLSGAGFSGSSSSAEHDSLWTTNGLPPGVLRSLASPTTSTTSSPQLSPRARTSLPPGLVSAAAARPLAAAQFPLPPPAPKPSGQQAGTVVGKDDILALIAAAQSSAPKQQQQPQTQQHQQAQHHQHPHQSEPSPFFSDPAILSASRLPSNNHGVNHFTASGMVGMPPVSAAFHSLDGGLPQGYRFAPQYGPPGMRPPPQLQAYQQYRS